MYRKGEKSVSTPACAREVARRAILSAEAEPVGSYWPLISAKVFTAFMFEGVIHHLGVTLFSRLGDSTRPPGRPEAAFAACARAVGRKA